MKWCDRLVKLYFFRQMSWKNRKKRNLNIWKCIFSNLTEGNGKLKFLLSICKMTYLCRFCLVGWWWLCLLPLICLILSRFGEAQDPKPSRHDKALVFFWLLGRGRFPKSSKIHCEVRRHPVFHDIHGKYLTNEGVFFLWFHIQPPTVPVCFHSKWLFDSLHEVCEKYEAILRQQQQQVWILRFALLENLPNLLEGRVLTFSFDAMGFGLVVGPLKKKHKLWRPFFICRPLRNYS